MISYEDVETAFDGSDYMVAQSRWLAPAKAQPGFTLDKGELMFKRSAAPNKKPPHGRESKQEPNRRRSPPHVCYSPARVRVLRRLPA